jgi:hypothetical protein
MMRRGALTFVLVVIITLITSMGDTRRVTFAAPPALDIRAVPIVPSIGGGVYARARMLIQRGKRNGNRLNVFSKIGDSITSWDFFLTKVGGAQLGSYDKLQGVIARFSGEVARTGNSFENHSLAAQGGWSSSDLLNPANADPGACSPGETPVACELRVTRPAVALIMIGTNDLPGGDLALFRANLNRILTIVESNSVVPVISTIPYRRDTLSYQNNVPAFNEVIVRVARAHSVPVWNFWLAMESLPSNGVSSDGIHPSLPPDYNAVIFDAAHLQFGFTMRNLTALQVLQSLLPVLR